MNTENEVHYTTLQYACKNKCPQTVKLLIEHGAGQCIGVYYYFITQILTKFKLTLIIN